VRAPTFLSGILSDSGPGYSLTKAAGHAGAVCVNTYSGGTVVNAGTLDVNNATALGAAGAGLTLGGGTFEASGTFTNNNRTITLTANRPSA